MSEHIVSPPLAAAATVLPLAAIGGVPLAIIVGAVVGAAWAASNSGKIEATFKGVFTTFITFAFALVLGVIFGVVTDALFCKNVYQIDHGFFGALCAIICSALSQTVVLPSLADRLGAEIKNRSV